MIQVVETQSAGQGTRQAGGPRRKEGTGGRKLLRDLLNANAGSWVCPGKVSLNVLYHLSGNNYLADIEETTSSCHGHCRAPAAAAELIQTRSPAGTEPGPCTPCVERRPARSVAVESNGGGRRRRS